MRTAIYLSATLLLLPSLTACPNSNMSNDGGLPIDGGSFPPDTGVLDGSQPPDSGFLIDGGALDGGTQPDSGALDAGPMSVVIAARIRGIGPFMPSGFSTASSVDGGLAAPVQVDVVLRESTVIGPCNYDSECGLDLACVEGACRPLSRVQQDSRIAWSSSAPSFVSVSNADGTRGQLTGVAPGSSNISATFTDSFGTIMARAPTSPQRIIEGPVSVSVVPSMLCDLVLRTADERRSFFGMGPKVTPILSVDTFAGPLPGLDGWSASFPSSQVGAAGRRAYYPHPAPPANIPGTSPSSQRANDHRVLLPNVDGISQRFRAIGFFSTDGTAQGCTTGAGSFAFDVSTQASWDVGSASNALTPDFTGATLSTDAAVSLGSDGVAVVVASATVDRVQAVRATINTGMRNCTGTGNPSDPRNATNPCIGALTFNVCGTPDMSAGSTWVTGWDAPNTFRAPPGLTNPAREAVAPSASDSDFYQTFVSDTAIRYYALQRFSAASACTLAGSTSYQMDFSERASWSSSDPAIGTVSGGALSALAPGTTSITGSLTFGGTTLSDSLDFVVRSGLRPSEIVVRNPQLLVVDIYAPDPSSRTQPFNFVYSGSRASFIAPGGNGTWERSSPTSLIYSGLLGTVVPGGPSSLTIQTPNLTLNGFSSGGQYMFNPSLPNTPFFGLGTNNAMSLSGTPPGASAPVSSNYQVHADLDPYTLTPNSWEPLDSVASYGSLVEPGTMGFTWSNLVGLPVKGEGGVVRNVPQSQIGMAGGVSTFQAFDRPTLDRLAQLGAVGDRIQGGVVLHEKNTQLFPDTVGFEIMAGVLYELPSFMLLTDPPPGHPSASPIVAVFTQPNFTTVYQVVATDADTDASTLNFMWGGPMCDVSMPLGDSYDPGAMTMTSQFSWHHEHPPCSFGTMHGETVVTVLISDGTHTTVCVYQGAESGVGPGCRYRP